jgi:hypothetical protein
MENNRSNQTERDDKNSNSNRFEQRSSIPNDLPDNERDEKELKSEETTIDLPDVKDIPGQEFVHNPSLDALGDTTIASDGEEGTRIFDQDDTESATSGSDSNVSKNERTALNDITYMPTRDEDNLRRATMDNTDFDGVPLNERSFGEKRNGKNLDENT